MEGDSVERTFSIVFLPAQNLDLKTKEYKKNLVWMGQWREVP